MCSVPICRVLEMESLLTSLRCVKQRCGRLSSCTIREFFYCNLRFNSACFWLGAVRWWVISYRKKHFYYGKKINQAGVRIKITVRIKKSGSA